MSIRSYHSLQAVQKTLSDQYRVCYDNQYSSKHRCLTMLEYIHHFMLFRMASSMGHFPDPLHLAMLLLQLLKGINNTQKMIHNTKHFISISALEFHIYIYIFVDLIFHCFYMHIICSGTTSNSKFKKLLLNTFTAIVDLSRFNFSIALFQLKLADLSL